MATCGQLTVEQEDTGPGDLDPSTVYVVSCPTPADATPEETQTVNVSVTNTNDNDVTASVEVTLDGEQYGTNSATISSNSTEAIPVTFTAPGSPGSYSVKANKTGASWANVNTAAAPSSLSQIDLGVGDTALFEAGTLAVLGAGALGAGILGAKTR